LAARATTGRGCTRQSSPRARGEPRAGWPPV
jgi:hypothetical protein